MNDTLDRFLVFLKSLPPSKKLSIGFTVILLIAGFAAMFMWANQVDYQVLFSNLSQRDAGAIIIKLKEGNIPYRIGGNGTLISVPLGKVHELRLSLAGDGLPKEGNVGFELFDQTDFGATKFVQELNYKRALQGELARSINQFRAVSGSRVFIVLPKESLFIEDRKPASASIQLDLRSDLPPSRLAAIVHLVANAVEGLEPGHVTLVDTNGRVIFKGGNGDDSSGLLNNMRLDYEVKLEDSIRKKVQSMLEGFLGPRKAIVRVTADIEFNQITQKAEEYDPSATAVRSKRDIEETSHTGGGNVNTVPSKENQRSGVVPSSNRAGNARQKREVVTNYEINKVIRETFKPAGGIKRLSVAVVVDGNYKVETMEDGTTRKTYIPRTGGELNKIEEIAKKAMGYNEDREDQVSVASFQFSEPDGIVSEGLVETEGIDILQLIGDYRTTIVNIFLVGLIFIMIVRPLLKSLKNMAGESRAKIGQLQTAQGEYAQISDVKEKSVKKKVFEISRDDPEKTEQQVMSWIGE